jgi:hypothetical protein
LERPPEWEADPAYSDPETGDTRFAGVTGYVQVAAVNASGLDETVAAEAKHQLQPYGPQPVIENIQVDGQEARLITPSQNQPADGFRQAAVISRYPEPVEVSGQEYDLLIIWADPERIRAIAQTVRFNVGGPAGGTTTPAPATAWDRLPPGLVFSTGADLHLVDEQEQPVLVHDDPQAAISPDGSRLLTYDAAQQDVWILNRTEGAIRRLTDTPDRQECCFSWWPGRPDAVLFQSTPAGAEGPASGAPGYLTSVGIDGQGYHVLDPEHAFGLGQFAPSPDGGSVAYSDGETGWLYSRGDVERYDPADYGLITRGGVQINQPAWSPDGARLAWIVKGQLVAADGGERVGVAVFELEARTAKVLHPYEPPGGGWPAAPAWSPDGTWLAFGDSSASEDAGLWVARAAGEAVEEHHLGLGGNPVWSPDGRWLAFQSFEGDGPPAYVAVNVETWERRALDLPVDRYGQLVDWLRIPASDAE